ncbi:MAG TPA: DUF192 domain-containing protein [Syntrophales bacterium]|jgi:uncharacterized membrane protein (UPF0127 family)
MTSGSRIAVCFLYLLIAVCPIPLQDPAAAAEPSAVANPASLKKILVGKTPLRVEVASTPDKLERGLMFRQSLPEDEGMLFIFKEPQELNFWMRNTLIPLDIAFIGADGIILNIHQAKPLDESIQYRSAGAAKYVVETNQGWFSRHGIRPGDKVILGR